MAFIGRRTTAKFTPFEVYDDSVDTWGVRNYEGNPVEGGTGLSRFHAENLARELTEQWYRDRAREIE